MEQAQFYTEIQIICWDSAGTQQSTFSILYIPKLQKQQRILLVNLFPVILLSGKYELTLIVFLSFCCYWIVIYLV